MNDDNLKQEIRLTKLKVAASVNREMISMYWRIGNHIKEHSSCSGNAIKKISAELSNEFSSDISFSESNLVYMVKFAEIYSAFDPSLHKIGGLPWPHIMVLIDNLKTQKECEHFSELVFENGWGKEALLANLCRDNQRV